MVNVTTSDILTEERIRRVIEGEREYPLIWNRFFRTLPLSDDVDNDTIKIPSDDGLMSNPERVGEGSEFPKTEEDHSTQSVQVKKHGFEVKITDEAQAFSVFDVVTVQAEKAAQRFNEYINELAFNVVSTASNQHSSSPISTGSFDFDAITDGNKQLKDSQLSPDFMVVNTEGENVLMNSSNFQRASELGDEITQEGAIGRVAGLDVLVDNSGHMADASAEAYIVDADEYGYEVVKQDIAMNEYRDEKRQADIMQWWTMREWTVVESDAVIKVTA